MNPSLRKYRLVLLCCCVGMLAGGCAGSGVYPWKDGKLYDYLVVFQSFSNNYLLSCLSDMDGLSRSEFDTKFTSAEEGLRGGRDLDKLRFICLSLNEKADYKQFKRGKEVLEQYLETHPEQAEDMHGFLVLFERLDQEIMNRWSAWKSLLNDKRELAAEVESLKVRVEEQQKQIEQLKNIEPIIKSREAGQQ